MTQSIVPSRISGTTVEVNGRTYAAPKRPTVVILVDGFDPAYLEHGIANGTLPTMKSFEENGFMAIADCSMPELASALSHALSLIGGLPLTDWPLRRWRLKPTRSIPPCGTIWKRY